MATDTDSRPLTSEEELYKAKEAELEREYAEWDEKNEQEAESSNPPTYLTTIGNVDSPIAMRSDFLAPARTQFTMNHKVSWSAGDWVALDSNGNTLYSVEGKLASCSLRRTFSDASGLPLFTLRISWNSLSHLWHVDLPGDNGKRILDVKPKLCTLKDIKVWLTFRNAASPKSEEVTLLVRGNLFTKQTHITHGDKVVATMTRNKQGMALQKHQRDNKYECDVSAGMDTSIVAVACIVVNDLLLRYSYHRSNKSAGLPSGSAPGASSGEKDSIA